ncbi:MAG: DUF4277 domain-containing protein [Anaerolineaceae bacterium]|nr:DUF4277 domain-containing protein [Anaerolineaceae bacterium]
MNPETRYETQRIDHLGIVAGICQEIGLIEEIDFVHVDSSSFHLHGQYEIEDPDKEAITVTEGYSRDHRPDLKQVVVQLITR